MDDTQHVFEAAYLSDDDELPHIHVCLNLGNVGNLPVGDLLESLDDAQHILAAMISDVVEMIGAVEFLLSQESDEDDVVDPETLERMQEFMRSVEDFDTSLIVVREKMDA